MTSPILSAIVVAHQDERRIEHVVRAVIEQDCPIPFEVIVVTSGRDRSADIVRERFPTVTVLDLGLHALPGRARNAGLRAARGKYVSFPGSHVTLPPGSLAARLRAHEAGHALVTGATLCGTPTAAGWASYFLDHSGGLPGRPSGKLAGPAKTCSYLRAALLSISGFPEHLRVGEDTDANARLAWLGFDAYYAQDVVIVHHNRCSSVRRLVAHHFQRGRGFARLLSVRAERAGTGGRWRQTTLVTYLPRRLWTTTRDVLRWGHGLRARYAAVFPLVALGATAAWAGMTWEAACTMARRRRPRTTRQLALQLQHSADDDG
jgi:glycosyltransferase involved in cell wall biosynthesis